MNASPYLTNAGVYMISVLFGLYILAVMLRFLLQYVRADFYNPVSQFLVTVTNPALRPLRRWIPGFGGIDWPSIVLLIVLQGVELCLIALFKTGGIPAITGLLVLVTAHLLKLIVWIYFVVIIVQVIISWIKPGAYSPFTVLMYQLTNPVIGPVRRIIPPAGGIDWSPLIILIGLNLVLMLLIAPLQDFGNILSGYSISVL
ncbi:MAG: YggT family protein [Gammaproteobacteria bacterium]|nr:YggT family protein [Gammaproteobacteria bacterium]